LLKTTIGWPANRRRAVPAPPGSTLFCGAEFLRFLREIDNNVPTDLDVRPVIDADATRKTPAIRKWLQAAALERPLHADRQLLDQSSRALLRQHRRSASPARRASDGTPHRVRGAAALVDDRRPGCAKLSRADRSRTAAAAQVQAAPRIPAFVRPAFVCPAFVRPPRRRRQRSPRLTSHTRLHTGLSSRRGGTPFPGAPKSRTNGEA